MSKVKSKESIFDVIQIKFEKMCEMIYIGSNGISFPYDDLNHDQDLSFWIKDKDFPILKEKMDNLIVLINNDHSLSDKDISNELWNMI